MKIYVTTTTDDLCRHLASALRNGADCGALVALATLGVGVAQALYSSAANYLSRKPAKTNVALDQHERHPTAR